MTIEADVNIAEITDEQGFVDGDCTIGHCRSIGTQGKARH
ncbi:hypothetical protein J2W32_003365 [Variovorax boronicumulans]|uniref:Uncharacterized protein n=1 Tax=Variovorax boronicumulans TaxID=436515 RepID=A0AAW8CVM0_9BURK|nr:hypothetical protein [Variovorax boronicumulans]MDQ0054308.1 hypothetical protein [Variovorax boronicumulans]